MSAVISLTDPVLRRMRKNDLPYVLENECSSYEFPWSLSIFRDCLRVGYDCYVYQLPERIIGHGIMSVAVGECHLLNVCVHPEYQGIGHGQYLINRMLNIASTRGADAALLEVRISNSVAQHVYHKLGFNQVGVRQAYYPARYQREDAIILAKNL
jgi:[ribosomal protein S18]-alanine N-acetyltransferase